MAPVLGLLVVLLASGFLQNSSAAHLNQTIFAVTVSSQVKGGEQDILCAHILGTEAVSLRVTLETDSGSDVVLRENVASDFHRCVTFQVPVVLSRTVAEINVTVEGAQTSMSKKSKILILPPAFIHIIQTDKPIYKPGQTVLFRIVSLDDKFIPVQRVYKEVVLEDPNKNRIAQWLDKSAVGNILDLSYAVIPEAAQGRYTILAVTDKGEKTSHSFEIKEYVLPKYEVKVHLPATITVLDQETPVKICGKYTYGKPVIGSVKSIICGRTFRYFWESMRLQEGVCKTYETTTDRSGCATQIMNVTEFLLPSTSPIHSFEVDAEIEEFGTGVTLKGSGKTSFTNIVRAATFEDVPETYKPGMFFEGKVKMVGPDDTPVANEPVYLSEEGKPKVILTTDSKGLASFSLDTSLWKGPVQLKANPTPPGIEDKPPNVVHRPTYLSAVHTANKLHSKSSSFVNLMQISGTLSCDKAATVHAQYSIQGEELKTDQDSFDFFFLVMSRGRVAQHGRLPVAVDPATVNKGTLSLSLPEVIDLAPFAQIVIYTLMPNGEVVADSKNFPIKPCFHNKVSLGFSSLQELPGEKTTLKLDAHPGSLCSVRAIDQSVLLLQKEQELTVNDIYNKLAVRKLSGYSYEVIDRELETCLDLLPSRMNDGAAEDRVKRSYYIDPEIPRNDVYGVFKEIGIKIVTNSKVKKPIYCRLAKYDMEVSYMAPEAMAQLPAQEKKKKETVRTFFPETWIWDLVPVGDTGSVNLEKKVPDTITTWTAGAFCVSSVGFGVSPNTGLTAFQPFFVSLTLPYSVIRGEVFTLKATVFNYLPKCIMMKVTLSESDSYAFRTCDGCEYRVCLCSEESRTFKWIVTPNTLGEVKLKVSAEALKTDELCGNEVAAFPDVGQIDTVVRTLLVEPEGTPQSVSHNALLCPSNGPVEKHISLLMPEMFVPGSARATVSVLGDLMGRAVQNLDKLLAMPYGCGEQNMVLFAPNIFILNYLKSTQQLTPEIMERATHFLKSGYQRELNYKHQDGSYSAFGQADKIGNTWLTSFVMKSFGGARPYIYVDEQHITGAREWLLKRTGSDGCVASVGKLLHNGMKGGVNDDVSLTAYVTAAMLELDGNASRPHIQRNLACLRNALEAQLDNLYTTALLAYTFTLAGDQEMRLKLFTYLDQKSNTQEGTRHWERAGASRKGLDSLEVEMTSYVLLALLSGPALPGFDLDYASGIVRWLTQQQNPHGGFSSTQDTVVALQALAKYGASTYSEEGVTTVTVTSSGGLKKEFAVEQSNRLLYQEEKLREVPGEYTIRAEGQSCVLAQISMHYNIPPPPDFSAFNISTHTMAKCNSSSPQLILFVQVRYQGQRDETNMVIINIKLLSGHVMQERSLSLLRNDHTVKRVDVDEGFVNIYLDGLKKSETVIYGVTLEQEVSVRNLKPAVVKVYDYYQTSDEAMTEYTSPCAEGDSFNEL